MASTPPICDFGWKAREFRLPATDGKSYTLADIRGAKGTLIVFICNHCPYVKAITGKLVRDAKDLQKGGIGVAAICSNDAVAYPEDGFDGMKVFARTNGFPFPYLHDESQKVAHAYAAVCTPDFFGFNAGDELQYRGRLDAAHKSSATDARRDLYEAMMDVARSGQGPKEQISSMGCSIKWKAGSW